MKAWIPVVVFLSSALGLQAEDSARKAAPSYTSSSVVNSASYTPGPLAPNTLATIFGTDLSFGEEKAASDPAGALPRELAGVRVYVAGVVAPLYYVSPTQVNFIVPSLVSPGGYKVWLSRQGLAGPQVEIAIAEISPSLFRIEPDRIIATHADGSSITPDSPASPGEVVVIYATGLGNTDPALPASGAPGLAFVIRRAADLRVLLNGIPVDSRSIAYAGVTPFWLGLYQVNLTLPQDVPTDPEVRLAIGDASSAPGLHLPRH